MRLIPKCGFAYAIPALVKTIAPSSVAVASAAVDVFFGAMIRPATVLAGLGMVLLLASFVWPSVQRRRPAAMLDKASQTSSRRSPRALAPPAPASRQEQTRRHQPDQYQPDQYQPNQYQPDRYQPDPQTAGPPTAQYPQVSSTAVPPPTPPIDREVQPLVESLASAPPEAMAWVEGQGYLDDPPTPRPFAQPALAADLDDLVDPAALDNLPPVSDPGPVSDPATDR